MRKVAQAIFNILRVCRNIFLPLLLGIFILYSPLVIWGICSYYAYQYVVVPDRNEIYDKIRKYYLMLDGQSFYKEGKYIYAYQEGVFLIIDNSLFSRTSIIIAYIDKDNFSSRELIYINQKYYNGKIKIVYDKALLSASQLEIYNRLKDTRNSFESQGLM